MHELSVAQDILRIIESERTRHGFERVTVVHVRAGALSGVDASALEFAFEVVREGTCAAEAALAMEVEPQALECRACGATVPAEGLPTRCPECGSADLTLRGTMDLKVVSLEVE